MFIEPGTTILNGEFKILEQVNRGAFGVVYRALDVNLNVERAIKIIRRDDDGIDSSLFNDFRNRFRQEAQLGAKLESQSAQHVTRVYTLRENEDVLCLIMEFMPSGSLADKLKSGALPMDDCLRIAHNVAAGLAEIHAIDLVHRNLKPSNILLDAQGNAKVADLGLAQTPRGMSARSAQGSAAIAHPGTPAYMSPEQRETADYLTPASDVYSFGLVLFEMLTGRHFNNVTPNELFGIFQPQPMQKMQRLLKRCLDKIPSNRPFNGNKLLDEFKQLQGNSVDTPTIEEQALPENAKKGKKGVVFVGLICMACVLVIAMFLLPKIIPAGSSDSTPVTTNTFTLEPTFTPVTPTPTQSPTVIPTPTPTPTSSATPTPSCATLNPFNISSDMLKNLGCGGAIENNRSVVFQDFAGGFMLVFSKPGNVWDNKPGAIVYSFSDGGRVWRTIDQFNETSSNPDTWYSCQTAPGQRPEGSGVPWRGFGKVWCNNSAIRSALSRVSPGSAEVKDSASYAEYENGSRVVRFRNRTYIITMTSSGTGTWQ